MSYFVNLAKKHEHLEELRHCLVRRFVSSVVVEPESNVWNDTTVEELTQILKSVSWRSAAGLDCISYRMVECVARVNPGLLLSGFDQAARQEYFPAQWTHNRITVIPKTKSDQEIDLKNQRNYRPITVTSCVMRVFEGILLDRLGKKMSQKLSDVQGGFVKGRGTMEQLFAVREICQRRRRERKNLALAFLDLQKAFDLVWHEGLLFKLWTQFGIRGKLWRLVKLLLESNHVRVEIGTVKTKFGKLDAGTRQGGKTSPLLFNIFIDDVVETLDATNCGVEVGQFVITCLLYADDIVLFAKSPEDLASLLEEPEEVATGL